MANKLSMVDLRKCRGDLMEIKEKDYQEIMLKLTNLEKRVEELKRKEQQEELL